MVGTSSEFSTLLELCHEHHRRIVLAVLATEKRSVTVDELTEAIARHNHHTSLTEMSNAESKQVRTSLCHVHLPKLADHSFVEYNRERKVVEPTPQFDQLEPQLSAIIDADPVLETPVSL